MEFIIEFILELALEGSIEASKNTKLPKPIRCTLIFLLTLFFASVIGVVFLAGVLIMKETVVGGIAIIVIGIVMFALTIAKFKNTYLKKMKWH